MWLERRFSPAQIAAISLAGAVLLYLEASFLGVLHDFRLKPSHPRLLPLMCQLLLPFGVGFWAMIWGWGELENGVAADLWPDVALKRLLSTLSSRTAVWPARISAAVGLAWAFAELFHVGLSGSQLHHGPGIGGFSYCFIAPWMTLQKLRHSLAPPKPHQSGRSWTENLKPIVSEHWGE